MDDQLSDPHAFAMLTDAVVSGSLRLPLVLSADRKAGLTDARTVSQLDERTSAPSLAPGR